MLALVIMCLFFFNDTATTEIYTLSLHDALPICSYIVFVRRAGQIVPASIQTGLTDLDYIEVTSGLTERSEEHTSELQSRPHIVCRLLLGKKQDVHTLSSAHSIIVAEYMIERRLE